MDYTAERRTPARPSTTWVSVVTYHAHARRTQHGPQPRHLAQEVEDHGEKVAGEFCHLPKQVQEADRFDDHPNDGHA